MPVLGTLVPSATCPFWAPCLSRFLHRPQWASTTFVTFFLIFLCRFPGVAQSTAGFCNRPTSRSSTLLSVFFNFFYAVWACPKARPAPPDGPRTLNNAVGIQRKGAKRPSRKVDATNSKRGDRQLVFTKPGRSRLPAKAFKTFASS